ncbi:hybrid sensor histidine kinase/response regulator [Allochromatium vinosum]|uniref:hybrid sensor histidine kinase/response regulator n=1 Tax=Allochromatium vinosum TaxID=1049 RepID=UPI0019039122|nr:ATP-binding protein [Allochromatium vinosum]MBK1654483.1 hybrid sensor histidine kinase/response regulator [Allochromatium vinosum]
MSHRRHPSSIDRLRAENAELSARLEEAEDTLRAIREGEVDAIIVSGSQGDRVFSLTETENLHRQMVETMNEAGLAISPDGLLLYCNERAATLLRRPRAALLGYRLGEFVAPQDHQRFEALLGASGRGRADDRIVFCTPDGGAVPLHLWASRLVRPEGSMICLVGTDLTRLEAERALIAQLEEQQQALSASRAEALAMAEQALAAQERAARSAQELLEMDRRKDAFLATLSHELRNPLASIGHALGALRLFGGEDGSEALEALAIIERQFAHLVRLLDDLLEVSRITCGKIDLRTQPVELSGVIRGALETIRPQIAAADLHLAIRLPPEPLWLEADPVRLTQVFGNLLDNAIKYSEPQGEIRLEAEPHDGGVLVRVIDTGIGIPADLLPHLFELFRQGDPGQSPGAGGLGIGLSLVKRLTELHGGWVEARSAGPGQGSEIRVFLPATAAPPACEARPPVHRVEPAIDPSGRRRVLIVDDNRDAANSLAALLRRKGATTRTAFDGPSALAQLAEDGADLVILDIGMPGMDGHEVARRIRRQPELAHTRLIAMSGLGQASDRHRSLQAGFDDHLVKPVALDVLDRLLDRAGDPAAQLRARDPGDTLDSGDAVNGATLTPAAASLVHDLAQPLNTVGCYAVAARNLLAKSGHESGPLYNALCGIEQQIRIAGAGLDLLRGFLHETKRQTCQDDTKVAKNRPS